MAGVKQNARTQHAATEAAFRDLAKGAADAKGAAEEEPALPMVSIIPVTVRVGRETLSELATSTSELLQGLDAHQLFLRAYAIGSAPEGEASDGPRLDSRQCR